MWAIPKGSAAVLLRASQSRLSVWVSSEAAATFLSRLSPLQRTNHCLVPTNRELAHRRDGRRPKELPLLTWRTGKCWRSFRDTGSRPRGIYRSGQATTADSQSATGASRGLGTPFRPYQPAFANGRRHASGNGRPNCQSRAHRRDQSWNSDTPPSPYGVVTDTVWLCRFSSRRFGIERPIRAKSLGARGLRRDTIEPNHRPDSTACQEGAAESLIWHQPGIQVMLSG
jgi:hypothetical protein